METSSCLYTALLHNSRVTSTTGVLSISAHISSPLTLSSESSLLPSLLVLSYLLQTCSNNPYFNKTLCILTKIKLDMAISIRKQDKFLFYTKSRGRLPRICMVVSDTLGFRDSLTSSTNILNTWLPFKVWYGHLSCSYIFIHIPVSMKEQQLRKAQHCLLKLVLTSCTWDTSTYILLARNESYDHT